MARVAGVLAGVMLAAEGRAAADEPRAVALRWSAPAGCPDEARVAADIVRLTGSRIEARSDGTAVDVEVSRADDDRWAVAIQIAAPGRRPRVRRVEGSSCSEVADATAVIVALALAAQRRAGADSSVEPYAIERTRVAPEAAPLPKPRGIGWSFAAIGGVDGAALPGATAGVGMAGALEVSGNRLEIRASAWLPRATSTMPSAGMRVALFAGAARYCRALVGTTIELGICAGFEAGALRATGFGLAVNGAGLGRWLAPTLAAVGTLRLVRGFALSIEAEGLTPLVRDRFTIDGAPFFRVPAFDGRALVGMRFEVP